MINQRKRQHETTLNETFSPYKLFENVMMVFWLYLVSCLGVVQLRGPGPWYGLLGIAKVEASTSFLFTEGVLVDV